MDRRKQAKNEAILNQLSADFYVTRGYLKAKSGVSYSGIDLFIEENVDDLLIERFKSSPTTGRAEIAYKLKG